METVLEPITKTTTSRKTCTTCNSATDTLTTKFNKYGDDKEWVENGEFLCSTCLSKRLAE